MPIIVDPVKDQPQEKSVDVKPFVTLGQYLKATLNEPFRAERNPCNLFGHDCDVWHFNTLIGYTYTDDQGNEGIVVTSLNYNDMIVELATMFEKSNPELPKVTVVLCN